MGSFYLLQTYYFLFFILMEHLVQRGRNRIFRTCILTVAAADTVRAVGVFPHINIHLAYLFTCGTFRTFIWINGVPV